MTILPIGRTAGVLTVMIDQLKSEKLTKILVS
jgi:hypothetical protein